MEDNGHYEDGEKRHSGWAIFGVIVLIIIVIMAINGFIEDKKTERYFDQLQTDVNYCRSVAARYGQQGTDAFSQAYWACLEGRE